MAIVNAMNANMLMHLLMSVLLHSTGMFAIPDGLMQEGVFLEHCGKNSYNQDLIVQNS